MIVFTADADNSTGGITGKDGTDDARGMGRVLPGGALRQATLLVLPVAVEELRPDSALLWPLRLELAARLRSDAAGVAPPLRAPLRRLLLLLGTAVEGEDTADGCASVALVARAGVDCERSLMDRPCMASSQGVFLFATAAA